MPDLREGAGGKPFTGYHMLALMVAFFGVIVTVNLVMARFAISSWSGLVVPNTYVASQEFNAKAAEARAISALGYRVRLELRQGEIVAEVADREGLAVSVDTVAIAFSRPVGTNDDFEVVLSPRGPGLLAASGALKGGDWIARVTAVKDDAIIYKTAQRIHVLADGRLRP